MISKKLINWIKISITLVLLVFLTIGFMLGYIYNNYSNKNCVEDPFSYGIKGINKMNNNEFSCSCASISGNINPFYFDETGILTSESFAESQQQYLIK